MTTADTTLYEVIPNVAVEEYCEAIRTFHRHYQTMYAAYERIPFTLRNELKAPMLVLQYYTSDSHGDLC